MLRSNNEFIQHLDERVELLSVKVEEIKRQLNARLDALDRAILEVSYRVDTIERERDRRRR